ncbi:hypothetical protein [Prevotella nigrescens]
MNTSAHGASCFRHQKTGMHSISKQPCLPMFRSNVCRNPEAAIVVTPKRQSS